MIHTKDYSIKEKFNKTFTLIQSTHKVEKLSLFMTRMVYFYTNL